MVSVWNVAFWSEFVPKLDLLPEQKLVSKVGHLSDDFVDLCAYIRFVFLLICILVLIAPSRPPCASVNSGCGLATPVMQNSVDFILVVSVGLLFLLPNCLMTSVKSVFSFEFLLLDILLLMVLF